MNKTQEDTIAFLKAAGQSVGSLPSQVPPKNAELHASLILEETLETIAAMGITVKILDSKDSIISMDNLMISCESDQDLVEIADGLADVQYVINGAAAAFGINLSRCHDEVQRSNMSKFIDGHRAENGKWIKGPSYTPADIVSVLDSQKCLESYSSKKELEKRIELAFEKAKKVFFLSLSEEEFIKNAILND
jgi:predicted HAD superfamily Cof-like phosphohydrolase